MPRTSSSHPIRVDWLPLMEPGAVGLTFAPGKKARSTTGSDWNRSLGDDLDRLAEHYHTNILVSLIHDYELGNYEITGLWDQAKSRGIEVWRHPIHDGCVPRDTEEAFRLSQRIIRAARHGQRVVIHCIGGLGRTGTIGGCVLCSMGFSPASAREILARLRSERCPETPAQRHFIDLFASDYQDLLDPAPG